MKPGILVLNFGGPQNQDELVPFLTELLEDVLPGPGWLKRIAAPYIANRRSKIVGPNYAEIGWSPLVPVHYQQVKALSEALGDHPPMASGMMFTGPTIRDGLKELLEQGVDAIVALPMFPHYSIATTQTAFSFLYAAMEAEGVAQLPVHYVPAYYDHPKYLDALAATIHEGVANTPGEGDTHLVFSPHGLPLSFVRRGDPYPDQVRESVRQVIRHMDWQGDWSLGWQSRVGPVKWLAPSTPERLEQLAAEGVTRVTMIPVSFVSDHIETLHEIDIEMREDALKAGITHFGRAPALELQPAFIDCLATLTREALTHFERYQCMRCLHVRPERHRRRHHCDNCAFTQPDFLTKGAHPGPL